MTVFLKYSSEPALGRFPAEPNSIVLLKRDPHCTYEATAIPWAVSFDCECGQRIEIAIEENANRLTGLSCDSCARTYSVERVWDSPYHCHGEIE